jgi:hypothetical protein
MEEFFQGRERDVKREKRGEQNENVLTTFIAGKVA